MAEQSPPLPTYAARRQAELLPQIVAQVWRAVCRNQPADGALRALWRQHREFGARDRRFFAAMVFAWLRWRGWLPSRDDPTEPRGLVAAAMLENLTRHAAVEYLCWQASLPLPASLPGVELATRAAALEAYLGLAKPPLVAGLVPEWLADQLFYPPGKNHAAHFAECITAFQQRPPTWIRLDTKRLANASPLPEHAKRHPLLAQAVALPENPPAGFNPAHARGWEVQDLASQVVGLVCAPQPRERWWDVCAGAGGKTLHLADLSGYAAEIYATDIRRSALDELQRRCVRHPTARVTCVVRRDDAADMPPGLFDGVLVDAPCSGIGTWHRNPDARWRLSAADIPAHAIRQLRLLDVAAQKVKPGGRLIYAVCTLTAAETEDVVKQFSMCHPHFCLLPAKNPLTGDTTNGQIWVWPQVHASNGMFIACWRRDAGC